MSNIEHNHIYHEGRRALELLEARNVKLLKGMKAGPGAMFRLRMKTHFPELFVSLHELYGNRWDFFYHLEQIYLGLTRSWLERPEELKQLDDQRTENPLWFRDQSMIGAMMYADRYAGSLSAVADHIPYLQSLGIRYLHIMPPFLAPEGENDGGYAISSYRETNPALGSMDDLKELASRLRHEGISLVLDFVFNHTSSGHEWALKARNGHERYRDFYLVFATREQADEYDRHLRSIFPDVRKGSFTWNDELQGWVWTTFNSFQWDLNYANPEVFTAMMEEMLFIANQGTEVLRLDALAFVWKEKGSSCENLPGAHTLIRCFRAAARIAAAAMVFKSEAIVHPDEVARYIGPDQCELSYNPLLMALLWESLATRKVELLRHSLQKRFAIDPSCSWVNYVRCHDDIGWTFADEDAHELGINGYDHRHFLNQFYTARFPGSFARGVPFQLDPVSGDCRISGSCASLAGIELGLEAAAAGLPEGADLLELGIRRHLLIHGIIIAAGGIPLLYLGDEKAVRNWYAYSEDPHLRNDSRWIHRPPFDPVSHGVKGPAVLPPLVKETQTRVFERMLRMIRIRTEHPAFGPGTTSFPDSGNPHVLAFIQGNDSEQLLVLANFSEHPQRVEANTLRLLGYWPGFRDLLKEEPVPLPEAPAGSLELAPLELLWLSRDRESKPGGGA